MKYRFLAKHTVITTTSSISLRPLHQHQNSLIPSHPPIKMATPPIFIDGVAVYRKSARYDIRGSKKYRSYPFPSSVLAPGNHASFPTPSLGLKLRIYCPFDSNPECTPHRCPVKSLVYTSKGPEGRPESQGDGPLGDGPFVVFRNDYKPLHPKQVQALWKYLRYFVFRTDHAGGNGSGPRYFRVPITDSTLYRTNLSNGRIGITDTIHSRDWYYEEFEKAYFKLDNFNAFFYITKHRRLVNGDESWRGIMSPYDV